MTVLVMVFFVFLSAILIKIIHKPAENNAFVSQEIISGNDAAMPVISLKPAFYEEQNFLSSIAKARDIKARSDIRAIVVPHHLLASYLISGQIKSAMGRKISKVVVIGPNHSNFGRDTVSSVSAVWQTPFGNLECDSGSVSRLVKDFDLKSDANIFENEHSIGAIAPYIKYYIPDAKLVPIIFTSNAALSDAEKLGKWLAENLDDDSLVILSSDFSHYLEKREAEMKDAQTKELIENKELQKIAVLGNDNVDSPVGLATILIYAENRGLKTEFISHANSYDLSAEKPSETTSYFTISFSNK